MQAGSEHHTGSYTGSGGGAAEAPRSDDATATETGSEGAAGAHHNLVAQPHDGDEGLVAEAEATAAHISTDDAPLGAPGRPWNRRSPFMIGLTGAFGVAVVIGLVEVLITAAEVLKLLGLALFLAVGLEPAVSWLVRHRFPRWAAVVTVVVTGFVVFGGFLALAIPVVVEQSTQFIAQLPSYVQMLQNHNSVVGQLNDRFHIQQSVEAALSQGGAVLAGGVLGAGIAVASGLASLLVVVVVTIYLVADLPRIRSGLYRLAPHSRRPRVILIGDEIIAKVGAYVLGNLLISVIAGGATTGWLLIFGVPYAALLGLFVGLLDLIPVVGSTIGGVVASAVALTVSIPVALGTVGFFVAYRLLEDYLLVPRIIGGVVKVPALVTIVAVLLGAALLGIVGALVAIPIAAAVLLIIREVALPSLDRA